MNNDFNKWDYDPFDPFIKSIKRKIQDRSRDEEEKDKKIFDYDRTFEDLKNFGKTIVIIIKLIIRFTALIFFTVVSFILIYLFIKAGIIIFNYLKINL